MMLFLFTLYTVHLPFHTSQPHVRVCLVLYVLSIELYQVWFECVSVLGSRSPSLSLGTPSTIGCVWMCVCVCVCCVKCAST
jgi:hypothetical protein